jgi:F-actin capping protein, beta subunit
MTFLFSGDVPGFISFTSLHFVNTVAVEGTESIKEGSWDSIHIVEAQENKIPGKTTYKLTTTCMVHMGVEKPEVGNTSLSGSLTRQVCSPLYCWSIAIVL